MENFKSKFSMAKRIKFSNTFRSVESVANFLPSFEKAKPLTMVLLLANSYKPKFRETKRVVKIKVSGPEKKKI